MIKAAQNQNQISTGCLSKLLQLKVAVKFMGTVNINIQGFLIKGQMREVSHIEIAQYTIRKVNVKFPIYKLVWRQWLQAILTGSTLG